MKEHEPRSDPYWQAFLRQEGYQPLNGRAVAKEVGKQ